MGVGYPLPLSKNNHPQQLSIPTLPIHYDTYGAPVMSKWCYQVRVPMLKAKIWPKTNKSSHNKVPVKAASQPEFKTPKKF